MRALDAGIIVCDECHKLEYLREDEVQHCTRCGARLHARRPDSIARTWALLITAAILYIPANLLPIMTISMLGKGMPATIMEGVVELVQADMLPIALVVFVASILVPTFKLVGIGLLLFSVQRHQPLSAQQRIIMYRFIEFIGRWSMLDIFVVTLTVALVRFKSLAVITAGPGALAFGAVVVLTMLAAMQFDPRLIWDPVDEQVPGEEEPVVVANTGNNTVIGEQHV